MQGVAGAELERAELEIRFDRSIDRDVRQRDRDPGLRGPIREGAVAPVAEVDLVIVRRPGRLNALVDRVPVGVSASRSIELARGREIGGEWRGGKGRRAREKERA